MLSIKAENGRVVVSLAAQVNGEAYDLRFEVPHDVQRQLKDALASAESQRRMQEREEREHAARALDRELRDRFQALHKEYEAHRVKAAKSEGYVGRGNTYLLREGGLVTSFSPPELRVSWPEGLAHSIQPGSAMTMELPEFALRDAWPFSTTHLLNFGPRRLMHIVMPNYRCPNLPEKGDVEFSDEPFDVNKVCRRCFSAWEARRNA